MRNPFLILRFVIFSLLAYLSLLAIAFAAWNITAMRASGIDDLGTPIFAIFNACTLILCLALALAELAIPSARTAQVNFETGWTGFLSALHIASAIDVTVNGPPQFCQSQSYLMTICASSSLLVLVAWTSSLALLSYHLLLLITSFAHARTYGGVWTTTVYNVPWFIERDPEVARHISVTSNPSGDPYGSLRVKAQDNLDDGSLTAQSLTSAWMKTPASTTFMSEYGINNLTPTWAQSVKTRRGVDHPFAVASAKRISRIVKSYWSGSSVGAPSQAPPLPPKGIPPRLSYLQFPLGVDDPDRPIDQMRLSTWITADTAAGRR